MFPAWVAPRASALADRLAVRLVAAALLVALHVVAFWQAGSSRLGLPFDRSPGETLYYSNPDAPAVMGYPRQPHYWSRLVVSRWDAQHYIGFAVRGLTACPTDGATATDEDYLECGLAWLPAYGEIGGRISDVTGIGPDWVLMVMSMLAAFAINLLWTSKTIVSRVGKREAWATLLAFNLYASAFFLVTPYPEAATFACMLGGFVCIANGRWWTGAVIIGASSALRSTANGYALAFGCAALVAAWQGWRAGTKRWWWPLIPVPLSAWGQIADMIVFKFAVGDANAYLRAHHIGSADSPGLRVWRLLDPIFYIKGFAAQHMDTVMVVGSFAIIALTARDTLKKFKLEERVFLVVATAFMMLLPLAAIDAYWGTNRYFLLAPLTFLCAGTVNRKYVAVYIVWLVLCAAMYWHVELCSYIAQGDPRICPCLGKLEAWFPF